MSQVALYYPSWGIDDPCFMFDALLYWDRLACIVPVEDFPPGAHWPDGFQRESDLLHEQFVTGIAPTDEVKEKVHDRLEAMLDTEPPAWCRAQNLVPDSAAVLSVRKVSGRTIDMLSERGWLADQAGESEVLISRAAAGILLGTLAAELASKTMPAITDQPATFRATCNGLLRELESQRGLGGLDIEGETLFQESAGDDSPEMAVVLRRISRLGVDPGEISPRMLRRLSDLRQDPDFDQQRELFREQVDRYLAELRERPVAEHGVLHDHWEGELARDRKALRRELQAAGIKCITEKEGIVATAVGAVAGIGALAAAGPAGLIIGLGIAGAGIADSARRRRAEVREKHWTSWLTAPAEKSLGLHFR